jgi:protein ImuB
MDRMACVDIRALPLQVLLRDHPAWQGEPAAVVDRDKPQGVIQWVNESARTHRILPGMRYAHGLSLCCGLHGGVVPPAEIAATVDLLAQRLWACSPRVEPSAREPGVFWLDAAGLGTVFPSLDDWAAGIRDDLRDAGFRATVAVGFTHFGTYAAAKSGTGAVVFRRPQDEHAHVRRVPVDRLALDPDFRDTLLKLGIDTLGGFIELPAEGIRRRFGSEADELHRLARGGGWEPLNPQRLLEPIERSIALDHPEDNLDRLLARIASLLEFAFAELTARHEALTVLRLRLQLDDRSEHREELSPASSTRDAGQLLGLVRLRLETMNLSAGVTDIHLRVVGVAALPGQLDLFRDSPRRNADTARRAFAALRAQLGNDAVVYARLTDGHLPEARYHWERLERIEPPQPTRVAVRPLVRRIFTPAASLPPRDRHEPDGWLIAGVAEGPVDEVVGPQLVSGGWWMREVSRAYHYVRTRKGRWLWIYNDHKRRAWFLHGEVQ